MAEFNRKTLLEALKLVAAATPDRSPVDVYQYTLLEAGSDGKAVLTATDGTIRVQKSLECSGDGIECLIPGDKIQQLLLAAHGGAVRLSLCTGGVEVKDSSGFYRFQTPPIDTFPSLDMVIDGGFKTDSIYLNRALPMVLSCVNDKFKGKFVLNGVRFDSVDGFVHLIGYDGHRACSCILGRGELSPFTVESRVLRLVSKMNGKLAIGLQGTTATFQSSDSCVVSSTLQDVYPKWGKAIEAGESVPEWNGPKDLLESALAKSALFDQVESRGVSISADSNATYVTATGTDIGRCKITIPGANENQFRTCLNAGLLREFLSKVPGSLPVKLRIGENVGVSVGDFCKFTMACMEVK